MQRFSSFHQPTHPMYRGFQADCLSTAPYRKSKLKEIMTQTIRFLGHGFLHSNYSITYHFYWIQINSLVILECNSVHISEERVMKRKNKEERFSLELDQKRLRDLVEQEHIRNRRCLSKITSEKSNLEICWKNVEFRRFSSHNNSKSEHLTFNYNAIYYFHFHNKTRVILFDDSITR